MAFTPSLLGFATAGSSVTSLTITTPNSVTPSGGKILVPIAINADGWDDVVDSASNVYFEATGTSHPNGTASVWIAECSNNLAIPRSGTITLDRAAGFSGSFGALAIAGLTAGNIDNASAGFGTSTAPNVVLDNVPANDWIVGIVGVAGPSSDGFTQATNFNNPGNFNTQTTTNFSVYVGYRQLTAGGHVQYQPTLGVSRDWVALMIALSP